MEKLGPLCPLDTCIVWMSLAYARNLRPVLFDNLCDNSSNSVFVNNKIICDIADKGGKEVEAIVKVNLDETKPYILLQC